MFRDPSKSVVHSLVNCHGNNHGSVTNSLPKYEYLSFGIPDEGGSEGGSVELTEHLGIGARCLQPRGCHLIFNQSQENVHRQDVTGTNKTICC